MLIDRDTQKLRETFHAFYQITGINVNLVDTDFSIDDCNPTVHNCYCRNFQTSQVGKNACAASDRQLLFRCRESKQPEYHICHGGLVDIAVPILSDNEILGYIILGQLKTGDHFSKAISSLTNLNLNIEEMQAQYQSLPITSPEKIQSLITIVSMLSEHVLIDRMLIPTINQSLKRATDYIHQHLDEPLSIHKISENTNLSKSVLYRNFHNHFHCTVTEYINRKRIEQAVLLLRQTDLSMEEISQKIGFSSASYFGRIFKKCKGCSPLHFRNQKD